MNLVKLTFIIAIIISPCLKASDKAAFKVGMSEIVTQRHQAGKAPGISVGYVLPDGTHDGVTAGFGDLEQQSPLKPDDLLLAGSVGKIFVAATLLQLVEEGKLALDDSVPKFLGEEAWFKRLQNHQDLTVRMLLNHTSGIPRYVFNKDFASKLIANPDHVWKPHELLSYILDEPATGPAGEGFAYADTNYILLGIIIEKVSGDRFYDQVRTRLLKPNGLDKIVPTNSRNIKGLISGYPGSDDPLGFPSKMVINGIVQANIQFEWTGGGYATAPQQLATFAKMLYEGKFHGPEIREEMFKTVDAPRIGKYGLGVMVRERFGKKAFGHDGFMPGYYTFLNYFPEEKAGIVVQINTTDSARIRSTLREDLAAIHQKFFALLAEHSEN